MIRDPQNWRPGDCAECVIPLVDCTTRIVSIRPGARFLVSNVGIGCHPSKGEVIALALIGVDAEWCEAASFRKIVPTYEEPKVQRVAPRPSVDA